jgi:hypothetical protein
MHMGLGLGINRPQTPAVVIPPGFVALMDDTGAYLVDETGQILITPEE